jgi:hypothetical protein
MPRGQDLEREDELRKALDHAQAEFDRAVALFENLLSVLPRAGSPDDRHAAIDALSAARLQCHAARTALFRIIRAAHVS